MGEVKKNEARKTPSLLQGKPAHSHNVSISPGDNKSNSEPNSVHGGNNPKEHDRIEAAAYVFLSLWVTADILVVYGHTSIALWVFYVALMFPLCLLAHHAGKGWPQWKKLCAWVWIVFAVLLPIFLYSISRLSSFSATIGTMILSRPIARDSRLPMFLCLHPDKKYDKMEISPVFILMYVTIVNDRENPMVVNSFSIEGKSHDGKWERLPIIDLFPSPSRLTPRKDVSFYCITEPNPDIETFLKHVPRLNFDKTALQLRLSEKAINPNEQCQGWVFLDAPKEPVDLQNLRLKITTGSEVISKPMPHIIKEKNQFDIQTIQNGAPFEGRGFEDISAYPIRYYSDDAEFLEK